MEREHDEAGSTDELGWLREIVRGTDLALWALGWNSDARPGTDVVFPPEQTPMAKRNTRRRGLSLLVSELEKRTLLASATWYGSQAGGGAVPADMTGATIGVGPDGLTDNLLILNGLDSLQQLAGVRLTDSRGGVWGYGLDPSTVSTATQPPTPPPVTIGAGSIAVVRDVLSTTAALYVNPTTFLVNPTNQTSQNVQYDPSTGNAAPSKFTLNNGDQLSLSVTYWSASQSSYSHESLSPVTVTNAQPSTTVSPTAAELMPTFSVGAHPYITGSWTQNNTNYLGWVHITLPVTSDVVSGAVLTDEAGFAWGEGSYSTAASANANPVTFGPLTKTANGANTDFAFPPTRNENGSTMTLRLLLSNGDTDVEQFKGGFSDPILTVPSIPGGTNPVPASNNSSDGPDASNLQNAIDQSNTLGGTIVLSGNYYLNTRLFIRKSVTITSTAGATLTFVQSTPTALWLTPITISSDNVTLDGLTIKFANSSLAWDFSQGVSQQAVINAAPVPTSGNTVLSYYNTDHSSNSNSGFPIRPYRVGISITNTTITGPASPPTSNAFQTTDTDTSYNEYFGTVNNYHRVYASVNSLDLENVVSGTLSGDTVTGGRIIFSGGPWTVTSNKVRGAVSGTLNEDAFEVAGRVNDLVLQSNNVSQADPNGRMFRFFAIDGKAAVSYNAVIDTNTIQGNVGILPYDDAPTDQGVFQPFFPSPNFPELTLTESYGTLFEGKPLAVSGSPTTDSPQIPNKNTNGYILVIPATILGQTISVLPGDVVSVLSGRDPGHESDLTIYWGDYAGQFRRVAQVLPSVMPGTIVLLMDQPMPLDPSPTTGYVISVTRGHVGDVFSNNHLDISGTYSVGIKLSGNNFGNQIIGNVITGGDQLNRNASGVLIGGEAFEVDSSTTNNNLSNLPEKFTQTLSLGTIVEGNTFKNSVGGGFIGLLNTANGPFQASIKGNGGGSLPQIAVSAERTYMTASVANNTWMWDMNFGKLANPAYRTVGDGTIFPVLKPLTIGTFDNKIHSDDANIYVNSANTITFNPSPTFGNSASTLYEGPAGFVDPIQVVVSVQGNRYLLPDPNSMPWLPTGTPLQPKTVIVSAIVNTLAYGNGAVTHDTSLVANGAVVLQAPQAIMVGQDNQDLVGSNSRTSMGVVVPSLPDRIQDLHIALTGLTSTQQISNITIKPYGGGGDIEYDAVAPATSGNIQAIFKASGATSGDLFFQTFNNPNDYPQERHDIGYNAPSSTYNDHYDIIVNYSGSSTPTQNMSVNAVMFDPTLQSTPTAAAVVPVVVNQASFVKTDATTQGSWKGVYGSQGNDIALDTSVTSPPLPSYATVTVTNAGLHTWNGATALPPALQKSAMGSTDRIASTWYSAGGVGSSFSMDVHLTDGLSHQVAFYVLDWDNKSRSETISVTDDSNGSVLDTRSSITGFSNGEYLVWTVSGNVTFTVTLISGDNAVVSGLFFDPPQVGPSVNYVKTDTVTQGNWKSVYGADGYNIAGDPSGQGPNPLPFGTVTIASSPTTPGPGSWNQAGPPNSYELLLSGSTDRTGLTWYASDTLSFDVHLTDGLTHQFALYVVDWDTMNARSETIQAVDDGSGAILDTRQVDHFSHGMYLVWNVKGNVTFNVKKVAGNNAVASGWFFR